MGLGSDSEPVHVSLLSQDTFLADSMQFAPEYFLCIQDGVPGVYYLNTSFRGEDPDSMHLNQFFHVECERRSKSMRLTWRGMLGTLNFENINRC